MRCSSKTGDRPAPSASSAHCLSALSALRHPSAGKKQPSSHQYKVPHSFLFVIDHNDDNDDVGDEDDDDHDGDVMLLQIT